MGSFENCIVKIACVIECRQEFEVKITLNIMKIARVIKFKQNYMGLRV